MGDVRLRCKYQQGQKPIPNVKETTTLQELQGLIEAISGHGLKKVEFSLFILGGLKVPQHIRMSSLFLSPGKFHFRDIRAPPLRLKTVVAPIDY